MSVKVSHSVHIDTLRGYVEKKLFEVHEKYNIYCEILISWQPRLHPFLLLDFVIKFYVF